MDVDDIFRRRRNIRRDLIPIEANNRNTASLEINNDYLDGSIDDHVDLGRAVGENNHLRHITFRMGVIFDDALAVQKIEAFCRGLINNRSIEVLTFCPCHFLGGNILPLITSFIESNPNLSSFEFHFTEHERTDETWDGEVDVLWSTLRAAKESLKIVKFAHNPDGTLPYRFGNEAIEEFCSVAKELPFLVDLELRSGKRWYVAQPYMALEGIGCNAVAGLLQNPYSKLHRLELLFGRIKPKAMSTLFKAIHENNQLVQLKICFDDDTYRNVFNHLVVTLQFFNHTLEQVDISKNIYDSFREDQDDIEIPARIQSLLQLNRHGDKQSIRIRKDLDYGFLIPQRPFRGEPFEAEDFDIRFLPHILSSIGNKRSDRDLRSEHYRGSALYYFVRNEPLLVVKPCNKKD